jgi:4-amino-4-deoxy-L-arabinose transferase-like glycosyltransferase
MTKNLGNDAWAWAGLLVALALVSVVRLHRLDLPLERDEGEYAYGAQLILDRSFSYDTLHTMKLPGVHASYALFLAAFGETPQAIRAGLLLVNAASLVLVFLLARRLFDPLTALAAGASFGILSLDRSVLGLFAHPEQFAILPVLAGTLLLVGARDARAAAASPRAAYLCSGALFGLAIVMTQQAVFLAAFGAAMLLVAGARAPRDLRRTARQVLLFLIGAALPYAATCALVGHFESFWLWTVQYPRDYVSMVTPADGLLNLRLQAANMFSTAPGLWLLVPLGLVAMLADRSLRAQTSVVALLFVFSFLATSTGLYFRGHYFVFVLPACALLIGVATRTLARVGARWMPARMSAGVALAFLIAAALLALVGDRDYLFRLPPDAVARAIYGGNPFPESPEIARYLREHTTGASTIAVMGSEPQILFYARRRSATGYIYAYPLMEPHERARAMQHEMIEEIEASRPEFIVYVRVAISWLARPGSPDLIFRWFQRYRAQHYEQVGVVEIVPDAPTIYRWDAAAAGYAPRGDDYLVVFRRRAGD